MSISYRKKQLIKEAVSHYQSARSQKGGDWRKELRRLMRSSGWKVSHPGWDKFVAIKGPLVAKWNGNCKWVRRPIETEWVLLDTLVKSGLKKNTPRTYVKLPDFMIQQNVGNVRPKVRDRRDIERAVWKACGQELVDCHDDNARIFVGKVKVIDGCIGNRKR